MILRFILFFVFVWSLGNVGCSDKSTTETRQEVIADGGLKEITADKNITIDTHLKEHKIIAEKILESLTLDAGLDDRNATEKVVESSHDAGSEDIPEQIVEQKLPLAGFGQISGACGVLDDEEWNSSKPFLFINVIDFGTNKYDKSKLSLDGKKMLLAGNLGGNSLLSEIFAYEVLHRCELAKLLKTEGKIIYKDVKGKKTDILLLIDRYKIGVSVTRAYHYPAGQPYTNADATRLLKKKLGDIALSATNASKQDAWRRSILHILAYNQQHADMIKSVLKTFDAKIKSNIIVIVTVTDGNDKFIYSK